AERAWQAFLDALAAFYPPRSGTAVGSFPGLTAREREVLELIAQGLDNAQIAARLELSEKTVRNNITHIFDKIGVENRSQAIVLARGNGLGAARRPEVLSLGAPAPGGVRTCRPPTGLTRRFRSPGTLEPKVLRAPSRSLTRTNKKQ